MSGHSKWSTIKRQKGAADAKRGTLFTKLGNLIASAVRESGDSNPEHNFKLRLAIERARGANMPNENIERAIKRGAGELDGVVIESVIYEAMGPSGAGIIIEALTDNKNRTASEIRAILTKHDAKLASPKSVLWQFTPKGKIFIKQADKPQDELELIAIEAGAEDVQIDEDGLEIFTQPEQLKKVHDNLVEKGLKPDSAELVLEPQNTVALDDKTKDKFVNLLTELDDNQDTSTVYSNAEL